MKELSHYLKGRIIPIFGDDEFLFSPDSCYLIYCNVFLYGREVKSIHIVKTFSNSTIGRLYILVKDCILDIGLSCPIIDYLYDYNCTEVIIFEMDVPDIEYFLMEGV